MTAGIDYGMGQTNVDNDTGIRYGVIPLNEVCQAWCDSSEGIYPENDDDEDDDEFYDCDPIKFVVDDGEYKATQLHDDCDIFVIKSPYYTLCKFCSPCAPGAGYLLNPDDDGIRAYCFGHDWFEDNKASYPVYRVADGSLVSPDGAE